MTIRLSEVGEYSLRQARSAQGVRQYPANFTPNHAAREALRKTNGVRCTEIGSVNQSKSLNGLGELVQVVTSL